MTIESPQDLAGLRAAGRLVAETLRALEPQVRPGVTTGELDAVAADMLRRRGARPAPALTYGFPRVACISVNDEAAHGIPGARVIREGDLVKLDVSLELDGYFADAAITVAVPPVAPRHQKLLAGARAALEAGIAAARAGQPIAHVGRAAERAARSRGFNIVAQLPAHEIGRALHEGLSIPMVASPPARGRLPDGVVITVEPHVALGSGRLFEEKDGWTLRTRDGGWVAQFEHTIVVTRGAPIVVTAL